jgi:hypothetical protein
VCEAFSKEAGAVMQQQSENKQLLRECRRLLLPLPPPPSPSCNDKPGPPPAPIA